LLRRRSAGNLPAVDAVDLHALDEATLASLAVFEARLWAEHAPAEPPLTEEEGRWLATRGHANSRTVAWIEWDSPCGAAQGVAKLELPTVDNRHLAIVDLRVVPEHRGRGIGEALLRAAVEGAAADGRTTLLGRTWDLVPAGARFAAAHGAVAGLVVRRSELDLSRLDRELMGAWLDVAPAVRERYELVEVTGPYPLEQYDAIADVQAEMDTAPHDDLDVEEQVHDADWVAQREAQQAAAPGDRWTTFVRDRSTGRFVGFTQLFFYDNWPGHVDQGNTGVLPEHRGHGLGRWCKAAMIERLWRERPDARRIWTTNAFSNAPMLAINDAMGFEVIATQTTWQVGVEALRRRR
jgi:RimJ/RimL family protein N-acetyltransferase